MSRPPGKARFLTGGEPAAVTPAGGAKSGGHALVANAGRVVTPLAAEALISSAGYGAMFTVVALCSLTGAVLLAAAERAHA